MACEKSFHLLLAFSSTYFTESEEEETVAEVGLAVSSALARVRKEEDERRL